MNADKKKEDDQNCIGGVPLDQHVADHADWLEEREARIAKRKQQQRIREKVATALIIWGTIATLTMLGTVLVYAFTTFIRGDAS